MKIVKNNNNTFYLESAFQKLKDALQVKTDTKYQIQSIIRVDICQLVCIISAFFPFLIWITYEMHFCIVFRIAG